MTPLILLAAVLSSETVIAVGLDGNAPPGERTRVHALLVEALRGVDGLSVVAIADPAAMLGPDVGKALASCGSDDRCRVASLGAVARGPVVLGAFERLGPEQARLDLRLVPLPAGSAGTSTASGASLGAVRVSRDVNGPLEPNVHGILVDAVSTLFAGRAVRPTAKLLVVVDAAGAAVSVDGAPVGTTPLEAIEVAIGTRRITVALPDGRRRETSVVLALGGSATVELSLRERTPLPVFLGGSALALGAAGVVLGVVADGTAADWTEACPAEARCAAGFTRARYDGDADAVAIQGGLATGLLIGAGVALVAACALWIIEGSP